MSAGSISFSAINRFQNPIPRTNCHGAINTGLAMTHHKAWSYQRTGQTHSRPNPILGCELLKRGVLPILFSRAVPIPYWAGRPIVLLDSYMANFYSTFSCANVNWIRKIFLGEIVCQLSEGNISYFFRCPSKRSSISYRVTSCTC